MTGSGNVARVVHEQIRVAEAMLAKLDAEHRALEAGDTDALNQAGADKAQLVVELEGLEGQRMQLADGQPSSQDPEWKRLTGLLVECQEQNLRNGELVRWRQSHLSRALSLLRSDNAPDLYDAGGVTDSSSRGRSLGEV